MWAKRLKAEGQFTGSEVRAICHFDHAAHRA
jgi:hypothetical protein